MPGSQVRWEKGKNKSGGKKSRVGTKIMNKWGAKEKTSQVGKGKKETSWVEKTNSYEKKTKKKGDGKLSRRN